MLIIESINSDRYLSAALSAYFARLALPVWKKKYPEDSRPEKAIEAAEKVLFSDAAASSAAYAAADDADAAYAANDAAYAANDAAYAANDAADAANAANAAANAASSSAAAADAAASAAYAAYAAADAAAYAANALGKNEESFAHHHLTRLLPIILWHKLNSKRSFGESEKVFELLPKDCREDFLFNLDNLR